MKYFITLKNIVALLASALSLAILTVEGLNFGISRSVSLVFDYYELVLNFLLGWLDPYIEYALRKINEHFDFHLRLDRYWRQVFVLLWLYFSTNASTNWQFKRRIYAVFTFLWGTVVAIGISVTSGVVIKANEYDFVFAIAPLLGIIIFELGRSLACSFFRVSTPSFNAEDKTRVQIFTYFFVSMVFQ